MDQEGVYLPAVQASKVGVCDDLTTPFDNVFNTLCRHRVRGSFSVACVALLVTYCHRAFAKADSDIFLLQEVIAQQHVPTHQVRGNRRPKGVGLLAYPQGELCLLCEQVRVVGKAF